MPQKLAFTWYKSYFNLFPLYLIFLLPITQYLIYALFFNKFYLPDFDGSQDQNYYLTRISARWNELPNSYVTGVIDSKTMGQVNFSDILFVLPRAFGFDYTLISIFFYLYLIIAMFLVLLLFYRFLKGMALTNNESAIVILISLICSRAIESRVISLETPNTLYRWPVPILHYLLLFLFLNIMISKHRLKLFSLALVVSVSPYVYLYTWMILLVFFILYFVYFFMYEKSRNIGIRDLISLLPILISAIYFLLLLHRLVEPSKGLLNLNSFLEINKLDTSRSITLPLSLLFMTLLVFLGFVLNFPKRIIHLYLLITLTTFVINNQQVVSGRLLQPGHLHWYFTIPMLFMMLAITLNILVSKKRYKSNLWLAIVVVFSLVVQISAWQRNNENMKSQSFASSSHVSLKELSGKYLSFNSEISAILVSRTKLVPFFDENFGRMYQNGFQKYFQYLVLKTDFYGSLGDIQEISTFLDSCNIVENSKYLIDLCHSWDLIRSIYSNTYGPSKSDGRLRFDISNSSLKLKQIGLEKFAESEEIAFFFFSESDKRLAVRLCGIRPIEQVFLDEIYFCRLS